MELLLIIAALMSVSSISRLECNAPYMSGVSEFVVDCVTYGISQSSMPLAASTPTRIRRAPGGNRASAAGNNQELSQI